MGTAERLVRGTLWSLVLASIIAFWIITFVRPSRWYRDTPGHNVFFSSWNMKFEGTKTTVGYEAAFLYGLWNAQILFQWLPNVSAVIFATLLMVYNKNRRRHAERQQQQQDLDEAGAARRRAAAPVRVWFKRLLSYQLPPRGFWSAWCDGMSVVDLLLVLTYLGLNICWIYETYRRTTKGLDAQVAAGQLGGKAKTQAYAAEVGTTWGWVSVVDLLLVFYPVARGSFLHWLTGTDFPRLIRYHRWMSHGLMWVLLVHSLLFYAVWWDRGTWVEETFTWNMHTINNLAGSIAWVISLFIWLCSLSWVRRRYFELFYAFHVYGIPLFMAFSLMHYQYLVYYMLPGLILYLLDLTFRFWQLNTDVSLANVSVTCSEEGGSKIASVELFFAHNADIPPASFLYLHFPTITKLQRHPFTIAETHRDPATGVQRVVVHVKVEPNCRGWAAQLFRAAQLSEGGACQLPVSIDGPYGTGHTLGDKALEAAVFVAGGIGATPAVSILLDLTRRRAAGRRAPGRLHLVWTAKTVREFEAMMPHEVLDAAGSGWLTISLHITGEAVGAGGFGNGGGGGCNKPSLPAPKPVAKAPTAGLLLGYDTNYWAYGIGAVLAFFGAFAGLLPGAAYDAHEAKTTTTGAYYSAVGLIHFLAVPLGAMLPPLLLVVLPSYLYRLRRSKEPMEQPHPAGGGSSSNALSNAPTASGNYCHVKLAQEAGNPLAPAALLPGRPDLARILADLQSAHSAAAELPVVVAGPGTMLHDVREACHRLNRRGGAPFLDFQPHTFVL